MKKKIFIAGCARSGTSALAQLIGCHSRVVMGMERYGHLVIKGKFTLCEEHFIGERFLNVEPGDTFYDEFSLFHSWDDSIVEKLTSGDYDFIGDKRPELYEVFDDIIERWPDSKCIYIYRNIYDVAASWNKRATETQDWPASRDFKAAVYAWNESLEAAHAHISKYSENICCIKYEDIFLKPKSLISLYDFIGLSIDHRTLSKFKNLLANSERLLMERKKFALSDEQKRFVDKNTSFRYEQWLDSLKICI